MSVHPLEWLSVREGAPQVSKCLRVQWEELMGQWAGLEPAWPEGGGGGQRGRGARAEGEGRAGSLLLLTPTAGSL